MSGCKNIYVCNDIQFDNILLKDCDNFEMANLN